MSILSGKLLVVCLSITAMVVESCCMHESYKVKLSDDFTASDQWVEFRPQSSLKADKTFQWVLLDLQAPFRDDIYSEGTGPLQGKGILMPDGQVINPDVELIDQYGNSFNLIYKGARGGPIYGYLRPDQLPKDREYVAIRIRSPRPFKCKAIYWYCESSRDWK